MFESIAVRSAVEASSGRLDVGLLAESLLFYGNVQLLVDAFHLSSLLLTVGPDNLQRLVDDGFAEVVLLDDHLAVKTHSNVFQTYALGRIKMTKTYTGKKLLSKRHRVEEVFDRALGSSRSTRNAARRFANSVIQRDMAFGLEGDSGILESTLSDLQEPTYVREAIRAMIGSKVLESTLKDDLRFDIIRLERGFAVDTNLDLSKVNNVLSAQAVNPRAGLTIASLLTAIMEARACLQLSSVYRTDILTDALSSNLMRLRIVGFLTTRHESLAEVNRFQEAVLGKGFSVREAINRQERDFGEFLDILERGRKFKEWLVNAEPDVGLMGKYHRAVTADTWIEKLPGKAFRFLFFTGTGIALDFLVPTGLGTIAGLTASAGDAFILDRMVKGWRPNIFVTGPLADFVRHR